MKITTEIATKVALKSWCESSLINFAKYIFKECNGTNFIVKPFHIEICEALERCHRGETKFLIINIPPRTGKTELEIMFMAWEIALNPSSFHLHFSYSSDLATRNSAKVRDYVMSKAFQRLWDVPIRMDTKGKSYWQTEKAGGVYSTSMGGQITGWGAGVRGLRAGTGAILIDDPLKPADASSDTIRAKTNEYYTDTIRNRENNPDVPHIVIMQRLHEEDLSGFLLDDGIGKEWEHIKIPALDENNDSIWEGELVLEDLLAMKATNPYYFAGQYMQEPAPIEGGMWKKDWFEVIEPTALPNDIDWECFVDGAYTKNTANDPSGITIAGKSRGDGVLYIKSSVDKWLEFPELIAFLKSHIQIHNVTLTLVEPKATGKSVVQVLRDHKIRTAEIKGKFGMVSKEERALTSAPYIEGGQVKLVKGIWNEAYLHQVSTFPNAKHDEHVDTTSYAIERHLLPRKKLITN